MRAETSRIGTHAGSQGKPRTQKQAPQNQQNTNAGTDRMSAGEGCFDK